MGAQMVPLLLALTVMLSDPGPLLVNCQMHRNTFNALLESGTPAPSPFEPYFDTSASGNVTALVGKSAYLSCRVRNLGNKTVSWIRHRDIHILTVGSYTYTSDQRFQSNHHPEFNEWTLQIKWAQKRDGGTYECQVSTQPVSSFFVDLTVIDGLVGDEPSRDVPKTKNCSCPSVPTAEILGGPELHVDKGSTINLTCVIQYSPEPTTYIFWYHQDSVISYDSSRGGVSVITEKGDVTTSVLLIQNAVLTDSGKYSCSPSNADVALVQVFVLHGETPAAMQTGSSGLSSSAMTIATVMVLSYLYSTLYLVPHYRITEMLFVLSFIFVFGNTKAYFSNQSE